MEDNQGTTRARELAVHSVPAFVIKGKQAGCSAGSSIDEEALRDSDLGQLE